MELTEMFEKNSATIKCSSPKCKSEIFTIKKQLLSNNGLAVAVVTCQSCGQILGQLEPSSVTSNLELINSVMNRVLPILDSIEKHQKTNPSQQNQQQNQQQNDTKDRVQMQQGSTNPQNKQQQSIGSASVDPAADPSSSDPEADQSLV
jgi:hypothetical protein